MSKSPFEVFVEGAEGHVVIELVGDLDGSSQSDLDAAYDAASQIAGDIVLDFRRVGYIDSTGIGVILRVLGRAQSDGHAVAATGLSEHYREVFRITRVSDFMTVDQQSGGPDDSGSVPQQLQGQQGGPDPIDGGP